MFTGIISATSRITKSCATKNGGLQLSFIKPIKWKVKKGDSITVNGVCSTVISSGHTIVVEYMHESIVRTTVSLLSKKSTVNIEQSMTLRDRLDGHLVQGHVDCTGTITAITPEKNSFVFQITFPKKYAKYVAEKGSITVDGISLTVVDADKKFFTVKIIPYTWRHTNLSYLKTGDMVNLEFDVLMKYVDRLLNFSR